MAFYQRIKDLREDADKTQSEIAAYLGTTAQYYGKYEKGERELPFQRAIQLADFYNVSLDYLAGRTNFPKESETASFPPDAVHLIKQFCTLSERSKGRVEQLVEMLSDLQFQQKEAL